MQRQEMKARTDAQIHQWSDMLKTMEAKADAATGDAKVKYHESVAGLRQQLDDMRIRAARTWDAADDQWDSASHDLELKWDEWQLKAKRAWDELVH